MQSHAWSRAALSAVLLLGGAVHAQGPAPAAPCGGWTGWGEKWREHGFAGEFRVFEEALKAPAGQEPACAATRIEWRVVGPGLSGGARALSFEFQVVGVAPGAKADSKDSRQVVRCTAGAGSGNACLRSEFPLNGGKGFLTSGQARSNFQVGVTLAPPQLPADACAQSRHPVACFELARTNLHAEKGDKARGVVFAQQACDDGVGDGCWLLGTCFEGGLCGMKLDLARAEQLFEKGCALGGREACLDLIAVMVRRGVPDEQLRPALERGCRLGNEHGCAALAQMMEDGLGGKKDPAAAATILAQGCTGPSEHLCLVRACRLGQVDACNRLLRCAAQSCDDIYTAQAATRRYVFAPTAKLACEAASDEGCTWQALGWREGWGGAPDYARALAVFEEQCKKGTALACVALGEALSPGSPFDKVAALGADKAAMAFKRGCAFGERSGCFEGGVRVAALVEDGRGSSDRKACERGDPLACERQRKQPPRKGPVGEKGRKALLGSVRVESRLFLVENENEFAWTRCELRVPPNRVYRFRAEVKVPAEDEFPIHRDDVVHDARPQDPYLRTGAWALMTCQEGAAYLPYDRR